MALRIALPRSSLFRKARWTTPFCWASATLRASSGVTRRVTTDTVVGLPEGSATICLPVASTEISSSTTTVWSLSVRTVSKPRAVGATMAPKAALLMVINTSTWAPGKRKPPKSATSSVWMAIARMPSGIFWGRPRAESGAAKSASVTTMPLAIGKDARRPTAFSGDPIAPSTGSVLVQSTVVSILAVRRSPAAMLRLAAT